MDCQILPRITHLVMLPWRFGEMIEHGGKLPSIALVALALPRFKHIISRGQLSLKTLDFEFTASDYRCFRSNSHVVYEPRTHFKD